MSIMYLGRSNLFQADKEVALNSSHSSNYLDSASYYDWENIYALANLAFGIRKEDFPRCVFGFLSMQREYGYLVTIPDLEDAFPGN